MSKVLESIDNFNHNLMSFWSEPAVKYDVNAANNAVKNLFKVGTNAMEKLVTPSTKENVRPMTKE
jgi:capsid portal protein